MKRILFEAIIVAAVCGALSLIANQLSPRGLQLGRDYFPANRPVTAGTATNGASGTMLVGTNSGPQQALAARLSSKGLNLAESTQVLQWFRDPRRESGQILFVDARESSQYQAGHVPGAYPLYYYRPEADLPAVLQAGQMAEIIVIYCNGGECEDSEFTAQMLAGAFPPQKLFVYAGGMHDWVSNSMPVEIGERNSGTLKKP